jgi:hypothetical protein
MLRFNWKTDVISACLVAASATVVSVQPTDAGGLPGFFRSRTSVEKLAHKIDELQEEVDQLGTVVIKQPDIWGEARLTRHRAEYEKVLEEKKDKFEQTIQATLARSDQAFLANALAVQAALGGRQVNTSTTDITGTVTTVTPQEIPSAVSEDGSTNTIGVSTVDTAFAWPDENGVDGAMWGRFVLKNWALISYWPGWGVEG